MKIRLSQWLLGAASLFVVLPIFAFTQGIYITQSTAEDAKKMQYLITQSKAVGINTFVIDASRKNTRYEKDIQLVKQAGIRYVARVVVFPKGGTLTDVPNQNIWAKRLALANYAVSLGANEIQLDYIRYDQKGMKASTKNAENVNTVIAYFKKNIKVPLQIDIFGIAAHRPALQIGQDARLFAKNVDAICPMVYPSHFEPYLKHAVTPYRTVLDSTMALKQQLKNDPNVKVIPYIELFNYRYPMSDSARTKYIQAQIQATKDSHANGWFFWSAGNKYAPLFAVLRSK